MPPRRRWTDKVAEEFRNRVYDGQMMIPPPGQILALCWVCTNDGPHPVIEDHGDRIRAQCQSCGAHVLVSS